MKLRKLFAWLMTLVMLLGMVPTAQAEVINCDHNWVWRWPNGWPANCREWKWSEKYCTKCGVGDGGFEQCGPCVPGSKTWIRPQGSNCQEYGVWEITCKYCGEWLDGGEEPGPHKWGTQTVEQPGCDSSGWKQTVCSVCGDEKDSPEEIPALGHNWGSWRWAHGSAPSCTEGAWQVRECQRCGRMEDRWVEGDTHDFGPWKTEWEATCTEKGMLYRTCQRCGVTKYQYYGPVDHSFGEWRVIEEPQVGIPGTERRACIYHCGTHEDREIPPLEEALELPGLELTLTLDSTPANGEYFVVGEQVVFTASWSNRSPFELFPFYVSIWPYEQPSRDSQDLPYSCSFDAEEPITTGMTGSHGMVTTVTEEDVARGGIYAMAFIWSSVHNGPEVEEVTTPFVTAPCAPVAGSDYATSIELEVLDIPSVTAEWAGDHFPGLRVSGKNSNKLTLKNIPGEMDGWLVYCVYSTRSAKEDTNVAILRVTDRSGNSINGTGTPAPTPAPAGMNDGSAVLPAGGELVLRTYGCHIQFVDGDGNAKGESFTELNFGEPYYNSLTRRNITNGDVDVRITADMPRGRTVEYWVINGAKYTFNTQVKSFTLREVPYGMVIEAVLSGNTAQTLLTAEEIQQQRTGETLLVETKSARMSHVNDNQKASGGYFTEFNFTDDYTNKATGETEPGGVVTVRVAASIPEGKVVTFWRFNGARLNFNSDVTSFMVENLAESMLYQPVFYTKTTPVPEYTITCKNCTFSGGGYTNAKSGTVPYGTRITITPQGNSYLGWWSGSYGTGEVSKKSITWTVKNNCSFEWHMVIN